MEASELKQKTEKELTVLLDTKRRDLWKFRFGASGSKARNVKEGKTLRRDIARILTVLTGMHALRKNNF
ncbi:MAG: 50S ribosomal protein L29 [Candidatus Taylorbacteria bacterium RIFCSPHIGHO2_02_FULL_46_13]|uniref:Large ribosomal subunit protein uL29 n=1 Tax=Candidatus Taylorbacteria bacterium RIFCSPHIGHO2_02_FULL_46_13 TaxID=1802312 RepID=A0A1G2MSK3_9BACT|nr:MAG: 50S ribosomal protein L29 [Candidatus Taylorbacteria bacterium RIFCSPHIGHO2_02_FULL_46_13]